MMIIEIDDEPNEEPKPDYSYDSNFEYCYNTDSEQDYYDDYIDGTTLDCLYMNFCLTDFEEDLPREKENLDIIIYPKELILESLYIWEIEANCRKR